MNNLVRIDGDSCRRGRFGDVSSSASVSFFFFLICFVYSLEQKIKISEGYQKER